MFNFTTQTIFNKPFVVADESTDDIKGANLIYGTVNSEESDPTPTLRIGNLRFTSGDIVSVEKKLPSEEALAHVTFDISELDTLAPAQNAALTGKITARFAFYIGLTQTSVDPYYANAMVYKGKPVYVEFPYTIGKSGEWANGKEGKAFKKAANIVLTQGEPIMTVSVEGTEVTFTCVNGYQIIREAYLQVFDPALVAIDCCNADGGFVNVVEATPTDLVFTEESDPAPILVVSEESGEESDVLIYPGAEAFADYAWMVHNLRLPTCANYNYWSLTNKMGELPAPGGHYVQYTIKVCQDRENIGGMVVGQKTHSVTTHVLYVLNTNVDPLDTALETLKDADGNDIEIKTTADTVLKGE